MKAALLAGLLLVRGSALLFSQTDAVVSGLLVGMDGRPIAGIQVTAKLEDAEGLDPSEIVTQTDYTGRYRFENIPPGIYLVSAGADGGRGISLRATFAAPVANSPFRPGPAGPEPLFSPRLLGPARITITGATSMRVDLVMLPSAVKVTGCLAVLPVMRPPSPLRVGLFPFTASSPSMPFPPETKMALFATSPEAMQEAEALADGTFEFSNVPPGSYVIRLIPNLGVPSAAITVADQDLNGIELGGGSIGSRVRGNLIPPDRETFQGTFPQRIYLVERGAIDPNSPSLLTVAVASAAFEISEIEAARIAHIEPPVAEVGTDGRFEFLTIPRGTYSVQTSPEMKFANTTITVAGMDVLNVRAGAGVKVSGEVVASNFGTRRPETISLTVEGPRGRSVSAGVGANGTFEFPNVGPGTYRILIDGRVLPKASSLVVGEEEVTLRVETPFMSEVNGRVVFESAIPLPERLAGVRTALSNGSESGIKQDGTFGLQAIEGEHQFFVRNLPEGYSVKSMFHGSRNLLTELVNVDASSPPLEILVTVEYKPGTPQ